MVYICIKYYSHCRNACHNATAHLNTITEHTENDETPSKHTDMHAAVAHGDGGRSRVCDSEMLLQGQYGKDRMPQQMLHTARQTSHCSQALRRDYCNETVAVGHGITRTVMRAKHSGNDAAAVSGSDGWPHTRNGILYQQVCSKIASRTSTAVSGHDKSVDNLILYCFYYHIFPCVKRKTHTPDKAI